MRHPVAGLVLAALALGPASAAGAADRELIVASQYPGDADFNAKVAGSADALATQLQGDGFETLVLKLGTGQAVPCIGNLQKHLKDNHAGFASNLSSVHFLGHGFPSGIRFPCPAGNDTYVDEEGARDPPGPTIQFGKAMFARLLDDLLKPDGIVVLNHCFTAKGVRSLAKRLADETGREVTGHTDVVDFDGANPPAPHPGDVVMPFPGAGPTMGYDESVEVKDAKGKVTGRLYCWTVRIPLDVDACDLHVQLPANVNTKKLRNWSVSARTPDHLNPPAVGKWKGGVTEQGGKKYASWYTEDCPASALSGVSIQVCVELDDPNAKDAERKELEWTVTTNGAAKGKSATFAPADVVTSGTTQVPVMIALQGDVDGNGVVSGGDRRALAVVVQGPCIPTQPGPCVDDLVYAPNADLDCSGCVDGCDLALLEDALAQHVDPPSCEPDGMAQVLEAALVAQQGVAAVCQAYEQFLDSIQQPPPSEVPHALQLVQGELAVGSSQAAGQRIAWQGVLARIDDGFAVEAAQADALDVAIAADVASCQLVLAEAAAEAIARILP